MRIFFILLCLTLSNYANSQTYSIPNGDFESWDNLNNFGGWEEWTDGTGSVQKVTGRGGTGNAVGLGGYNGYLMSGSTQYNFVVIAEGRPTALTGYVKAANNFGGVDVKVELYKQGGNPNTGAGKIGSTSANNLNNMLSAPDSLGWKYFYLPITYTTNDNASLVHILITSNGGGAEFDDIGLSESSIGFEELESEIAISPNPTSGLLSIDVTTTADYRVCNMTGQVLAEGKTAGQIDITSLPSGTYLLTISSEEVSITETIYKL